MSLADLSDTALDTRLTAIRTAIDKYLETGGLSEIRVDDRMQRVDINTLRAMEAEAVSEKQRRAGTGAHGVKRPVLLDR